MAESDEETVRALDGMRQIAPPPELRKQIMQEVRRRNSAPGSVVAFRSARRRMFTVAWAAAAALIVLFLVISRPKTEDRDTSAAMLSVTTKYTSDKATLLVRRRGDFITLIPVVEEPGSISIGWDPNSAVLVVISGAADASSGKDQTTFTLRSSSQRVAVTLRTLSMTGSTPVRVSVGNEEVIRADVPLE